MIAIYARQSLDKKDSISIETQIDFCKREVPDNEEVEIFQDKGFSGRNIDRPSFTELMKSISDGDISKLIVYRLDRISRSITDFANIIDILEENKVDFVSANEKFDTSTPVGRAMLYIIMVFAQLERETIAERIKDNYYSRGKTGVWLGGPPPLGFNIKKIKADGKMISTLEPNSELDVVREVFEMYATKNISLGGIAKIMKDRQGVMWNNIKLSRILHNPVYVKADVDVYNYYRHKKCIIVNEIHEFTGINGCALYGKRDRSGNKYNLTSDQVLSISKHEGVIDSQTWLICQNKLSANKQIKNTGKGKHSWLTGLMKCGYCGYTLTVKVYNKKKYLYCTGHLVTNLCTDKLETHYLTPVEDYALKALSEYSKTLETKTIRDEKKDNFESNKLKIELHEIETQIDKLVSSLISANAVLMEYINKKVSELDERKVEILRLLNESFVVKKNVGAPDLTDWELKSMEERKDIAANFISKVKVFNDKIEVVWKF